MSAKRIRMSQLREILRLKFEVGLSHRAIVRACGVGLGTVTDDLQPVEASGTSMAASRRPGRRRAGGACFRWIERGERRACAAGVGVGPPRASA